jgi:hypothetical protein
VKAVGTVARSYLAAGPRPNRLDRRLTDPKIPGDLTLWNTVRDQPPDQSPILH